MSYFRFDRNTPNMHEQRGAAFIVMLVVLVLGIATVLVTSLSTAGLKIERDVKTAEALAQAKEALIGEAAIHDKYPGSLPCPDLVTNNPGINIPNDGIADMLAGNDCPSYIGRLPWKTLGLPDLRDAAGERLWYALSRNVRRDDSVRPLNSDVVGTLNISGTNNENNLMAIVFAPGATLGVQRRSENDVLCSSTGTTIKESRCAANYLEGTNDDPSPGAAPNVAYQSSDAANDFNDQLITISHDQLFATVEKRVAREIRSLLATYYTTWSAYPDAAPFMNPASAYTYTSPPATRPFIGVPGTYNGHLPMGAVWTNISASVSGGSATIDCELKEGYNNLSNARARCDFESVVGTPTFTMSGTLKGLRLWSPHNMGLDTHVRIRRNGIYYPPTDGNVTGVGLARSYTLKANGDVDVVITGTIISNVDRIDFRDVIVDTTADPVDPAYAWFTRNEWHHVMYYVVSPGYAPGGGNSCTPLPGVPSCLTVNGSANNNAAVIMTGRTIAGAHPSGTLSDYLEGQNLTPADYTFENQPRSTTFNDQVIIIAP